MFKIKKSKKRYCIVKPLKTKVKTIACYKSKAAATKALAAKRRRKVKRKTRRRTRRRR